MIFTVSILAVLVLVTYHVGRNHGRREEKSRRARDSRWPKSLTVISLSWLDDIPVAELECDPSHAQDVARWLDAVKEGTVIRA